MGKQKPKPQTESAEKPERAASADTDVILKSAGKVQISYRKHPERAPEGKRIHSRRPLPLVREAPITKEDCQDDLGKESGAGKRDS